MLTKLILKQLCTLCGSHDAGHLGLCESCLLDLPWHTVSQCPQCSLNSDGNTCGSCLTAPPSFDATTALFTYDFPLDRLLQQYKYRESLQLANTFAMMLHQKLSPQKNSSIIDLIIPMPMHAKRLQERGFNQAIEIAKLIAKFINLPLDYNACQRVKITPPQASLPLKERSKNIRGVFQCNKDVWSLNVAIVDDVMTTGASLDELAKTLKQAGAAHVECWVIARTLPK
ncbi:MAG: ComF family protein [Methylotenera sp.]|nr:ComF family protein [Methylotenera sp.]